MLINDSNRRVIGGIIVWEGLVGLRRYKGAVEIRFYSTEKSGIHSIDPFGRSGRPELRARIQNWGLLHISSFHAAAELDDIQYSYLQMAENAVGKVRINITRNYGVVGRRDHTSAASLPQ